MASVGLHRDSRHTGASVRVPFSADGPPPRPGKRYDLDAVRALPRSMTGSGWPAVDTLSGSVPPAPERLDQRWIASLLFHAVGVTRPPRLDRPGFRAAASAGATYPYELYLVANGITGIPVGVHHVDPDRLTLARVRTGATGAQLAAALADPSATEAAAALVVTGVASRATWRYAEHGYRELLIDAGTVLGHALTLAEAAGVPTKLLYGFVDDALATLVGATDPLEWPLAALLLRGSSPGNEAEPAAGGAQPGELDGGSVPPAVVDAHKAGELADVGGVGSWRQRARALPSWPARTEIEPPVVAQSDRIEDVVLRRAATPAFVGSAVRREALRWPLEVALRPHVSDAAAPRRNPLTCHVVVHAVEGLDRGVHRFGDDTLRRVAAAERPASRFAGLEQDAAGDAAYLVVFATDVAAAVGAAGDRAYRMLLLEAGIAAGRLQLAAHAVKLGARELTFYDDELADVLRIETDPLALVAVGEPTSPAAPGVRPG